mmetsp:Transcript_29800/g.70856  ORF Transcript_29800/g.70856 Transcript_29800/m.70856 type:complete len:378 (-) Transcript_29800:1313-2446(-)
MNDSHGWQQSQWGDGLGAAASTFPDDHDVSDINSVEGLLDCIERLDEDEDFEDRLSCSASSPSSARSQNGKCSDRDASEECEDGTEKEVSPSIRDDETEISVIPLNDRQVFSSSPILDSSSGSSTPGEFEVESSDFRPRASGRATLARRITSLGDSTRSLIGEEPDLDADPSEEDTKWNAASSCRGQTGGTKRKKRVTRVANIPSKSDLAWSRRFNELKEFKQDFGHTNVKQTYEANASLGAWVARQRLLVRRWDKEQKRHAPSSKSALMNKRIELLRSLDFEFYVGKGTFSASSPKNSKDWELAFGKLLEYKATKGDCNVPTKTSPLGRWVANQRKKYKGWNQKKTGASKEVMRRFDQLQKIGFVFELGRGNAKKY